MTNNKSSHTADLLKLYGLPTATIHSASLTLTKNLNLEQVLDILLNLLKQLVLFDVASVMLLESNSRLTIRALSGSQDRIKDLDQIHQKIFNIPENSILQTAIKENVIIQDTRNHPDWIPISGFEFIRSWIIIPLVVRENCLGLYFLGKSESNFFTSTHVLLAESLAPQAALAIQNNQRNTKFLQQIEELESQRKTHTIRLEKQNQRQNILAELKIALNHTQQLQDILKKIIQAVVELLPSSDASIILWDAKLMSFISSASTLPEQDDALPAQRVRRNGGASRWIIENQKPLQVPDIRKDLFGANKMLEEFGYQAYIGVPLPVQDESIGVLYGLDREPRDYHQTDVAYMKVLANQAAAAIQSARLLEQLQEHIKLLEERVTDRTRELSDAHEQLQELNQLKTKFINDVSHELRTPLTNLHLYIRLLESGKSEKRQHYLNVLKQSADRLEYLVEGVLNLSHLDEDNRPHFLESVPINQFLEVVTNVYRSQAEKKKLDFHLNTNPNLPNVWVDKNEFNQAISILLKNAISYTSAGRVEINTLLASNQDRVGIQVNDTGMGITPKELTQIFEPFYRSDRVSQSTIPGIGIGLSILKEISDNHQWELHVESQVDIGSSFTLWLPAQSDIIQSADDFGPK